MAGAATASWHPGNRASGWGGMLFMKCTQLVHVRNARTCGAFLGVSAKLMRGQGTSSRIPPKVSFAVSFLRLELRWDLKEDDVNVGDSRGWGWITGQLARSGACRGRKNQITGLSQQCAPTGTETKGKGKPFPKKFSARGLTIHDLPSEEFRIRSPCEVTSGHWAV